MRLVAFHDWWFDEETNYRFATCLSLLAEPVFSFPTSEKLVVEVAVGKQRLYLEYNQPRNISKTGESSDYRVEVGFIINALNHLLKAIDSPLRIVEVYDERSDEVLFVVVPKDRIEAFYQGLKEFIVPKTITTRQNEFERKLVSKQETITPERFHDFLLVYLQLLEGLITNVESIKDPVFLSRLRLAERTFNFFLDRFPLKEVSAQFGLEKWHEIKNIRDRLAEKIAIAIESDPKNVKRFNFFCDQLKNLRVLGAEL